MWRITFNALLAFAFVSILIGCGQEAQIQKQQQNAKPAPATAPQTQPAMQVSPPVTSEKATDFVMHMPEVQQFSDLVEAHRGERAIVGVDLRPGQRLETMPRRLEYTWPAEVSDYYVVGVSTTNARRSFRWQVFFIEPETGKIHVLRDRDSGELITLRNWRERSEPGSIDPMRRILHSE